jgi:hypothetical protein
MGLHFAVTLEDEARRTAYAPTLSRHGIVHWCDSPTALERAVGAGAGLVMLGLDSRGGPPALGVLTRLRSEHPTLILIVAYDPASEELADAAKLSLRRLGLWFTCEPDDELELLLNRCGAGPTLTPTPPELAVECVAELSPAPAACRYAWFCGLTPLRTLGEAASAARCGEKLRTVQRQFADIGVTASGLRRAFQTLHAAYWLSGYHRETSGLAGIFGRRSARALREGIKGVLGVGVQELRHNGGLDIFSRRIVPRLRSEPAGKPRRRRLLEAPCDDPGHYRVAPRVSVTLTGDTIVANLDSETHWALAQVTGAVLVELMQGRSPRRIVARIERDYGRTRREARAAVEAALLELAVRGVVDHDQDRIATLPA